MRSRAGEIDVYVDYSGTIWTNQMHRTDVQAARRGAGRDRRRGSPTEHGIAMLGGLGFENAYALAMPRAARRGARHPHASPISRATRAQLSIAGDYEFFARPEWAALREAYGLDFREQRQMQPEFMYAAVADGEVDVIAAYTSDGRIAQYDLVVLDDPKHAIPPYDAILLVSPQRANDQALLDALRPLVGAIDVDADARGQSARVERRARLAGRSGALAVGSRSGASARQRP